MRTIEQLVSAIIPVHNGASFLGQAIDSVSAQTYRPVETIVVDDGSTDHTAEIARGYPLVRYARQDQAGQAAARNRGASLAKGEFLGFLDADDLWMRDKLERQVETLRASPELEVVFGCAEEFLDADGVAGAETAARGVRPAHLPSAMLIRRRTFDLLGGFDPRWKQAESADFYARILEDGVRCKTLDRTVYRRRIHGRNFGIVRKWAREEYVAVLAAAIARRREGSRE